MQAKPTRNCFIVQPFGAQGTPENEYFTDLYERSLKPNIQNLGYHVERGDSSPGAGEIMGPIIEHLAKDDLVVADLTMVNPNVFYELGVRHALRGLGTILIMNTGRTAHIPFNINHFRVIEFDDSKFLEMQSRLVEYIKQFEARLLSQEGSPDNPVHSALKELPVDVLAALDGTETGKLQLRLSDVQDELRRYHEIFGDLPDSSAKTPIQIANEVAQVASGGHLPSLIMDDARRAVEALDPKKFITAVQDAMNLNAVSLSAEQFYDLATYSQRFDLTNLTSAIYEEARRLYPSNSRLLRARMSFNSRSTDPTIRHQAQQDILNYLHISFVDGKVVVPEVEGSAVEVSMVGTLLDSYNGENEIDKALQVIETFYQQFPKRTLFARNYGRQLEYLGRRNEALDYYRQALWCPDVNDTTAIWLGVELYNRQRYVDSAEAFCLAAILDATDANGFVQTADAITQAMINEQRANSLQQSYPHRRLPAGIDDTAVAVLLMSAVSCELLSQENVDLAAAVGARVGIDWARIMKVRSEGQSYTFKDHTMSERLDMNTRMQNVQAIYEKLRSPVTERPKKGA